MDVTDMAVQFNGYIIYIIKNGAVYKSNTSAFYFGLPFVMPSGFVAPARCIAIAPDDPNVVAVSDSKLNGNQIWVSFNGGITWVIFGIPKASAATVTDIAIAQPIGTPPKRYYFATVADNAYGITVKGDVMATASPTAWSSVGGVGGTHDYMAIQVSPHFPIDYCICVVGATPAAGIDYQIISLNSNSVLQTVKFILPGTTKDFRSPPAGYSILYADIALPPDFIDSNTSNIAFVSIATQTLVPTDGVYRINNQASIKILPLGGEVFGIKSIDYHRTMLLAGERATHMVWRSTNPLFNLPNWYPATLPPSGLKEVEVGMNSSMCFAGTRGGNSGLSRSNASASNFQLVFACAPDERVVGEGEGV
jgi:hypothetical protein